MYLNNLLFTWQVTKMADPHIIEKLDALDKAQVVLYRLGIMLSGIALTLPALAFFWQAATYLFQPALIIGSILIAASLHIYSKLIRLILSHSTWVALIIFSMNQIFELQIDQGWINGFLLITLSGIAFKESFCFKIPGLKLTPAILFIATIAQLNSLQSIFIGACLIAALLTLFMSIAKWRMPLHFDIGDKTKYQI